MCHLMGSTQKFLDPAGREQSKRENSAEFLCPALKIKLAWKPVKISLLGWAKMCRKNDFLPWLRRISKRCAGGTRGSGAGRGKSTWPRGTSALPGLGNFGMDAGEFLVHGGVCWAISSFPSPCHNSHGTNCFQHRLLLVNTHTIGV